MADVGRGEALILKMEKGPWRISNRRAVRFGLCFSLNCLLGAFRIEVRRGRAVLVKLMVA